MSKSVPPGHCCYWHFACFLVFPVQTVESVDSEGFEFSYAALGAPDLRGYVAAQPASEIERILLPYVLRIFTAVPGTMLDLHARHPTASVQ